MRPAVHWFDGSMGVKVERGLPTVKWEFEKLAGAKGCSAHWLENDMFKQFKRHGRTASPDFLVDTAEYQGVSTDFEPVEELTAKKLRRDQSLHEQLMCEELVQTAIESLFEGQLRLDIVIAGWIDQAVLEFHLALHGDKCCLPRIFASLDAYRPDQNGDVWFYLADLDYNEVIATRISFEDSWVDSKRYRPIGRAESRK